MRRLILLALIALVVFGISQQPHAWANGTSHVGHHIADIARGFGTFITDVLT